MAVIDSPQNQHAKLFRSLAEARHRREVGLFPLEGRRLVGEALRAGAKLSWAAYCPRTFTGVEADRLLRGLMDAEVELLEVTPRALESMSQTVTPQGIAAVAALPAWSAADLDLGERGWVLGAWEIRDPGNLGTMIRTAHALGAAGVVAVGDCVDFWDPKVVRASAGSVLHLPLVEMAGGELPGLCAEKGLGLVVADMAAETPCDRAGYPPRALLLVGSEAHGVPEELVAGADLRVSIPMPGGAESLNAAVAAGIIAFCLARAGAAWREERTGR